MSELANEPKKPNEAGRAEPRRVRRGRWWRGLTGSLAAGLAVLALGVLVAQIVAWSAGGSGPGGLTVTGHVVAAVLVLVAQRIADRRLGRPAALAAVAVLALTGAVLWFFWWW